MKVDAARSHGIRMFLLLVPLSCGGEPQQADSSSETIEQMAKQSAVSSPSFSVTGCHPASNVLCVQDTAIGPENPDDPSMAAGARWIIFAAKGDSVQISARPNVHTPIGDGVAIGSNIGQERTPLNVTAPYLRRRVTSDRAIFVRLIFDSVVYDEILGDTVTYTLRVRRDGLDKTPSLRSTGQRAILTLVSGRGDDEFRLIPISLATGTTDFAPWKIYPGTYRVLLVPDSLYQLCRLPCEKPDTVKLTPWATVTKQYK